MIWSLIFVKHTILKHSCIFLPLDKVGLSQKLYEPQLISLEMDGIDFHNEELGEACLTEFFEANKTLQKLSIAWTELKDTMLSFIGEHSPHLRELSLVIQFFVHLFRTALLNRRRQSSRKTLILALYVPVRAIWQGYG